MKQQKTKREVAKRLARIRDNIHALKCSTNAIHHTENLAELHSLISVLTESLTSAVDIAEEDLIELFRVKTNS